MCASLILGQSRNMVASSATLKEPVFGLLGLRCCFFLSVLFTSVLICVLPTPLALRSVCASRFSTVGCRERRKSHPVLAWDVTNAPLRRQFLSDPRSFNMLWFCFLSKNFASRPSPRFSGDFFINTLGNALFKFPHICELSRFFFYCCS